MIEIKHNPDRLVFEAWHNGEKVGKMTYTHHNENAILVNHTGVRPDFEGQGIGKKLVLAGLEFARQERKKIIPRCSFVRVVLESKEEYRDVL